MKKNHIILALLLITALLAASCGGGDSAKTKEQRPADDYFTVSCGGLEFLVPDYFEAAGNGDGLNYYAETDNAVVNLQFLDMDMANSEEDFDKHNVAIRSGFFDAMESSSDDVEIERGELTESRLPINKQYAEQRFTFSKSGGSGEGSVVFINNVGGGNTVRIVLIQSDESEYDYMDMFELMIAGTTIATPSSE